MPQYTAGVRYIKIAKKDKNGVDQTNTLQSLTEITIPFSSGNITYNIISITEKPTYFLYSVPYTGVEWADRSELYYGFTGSANTNATPAQYANKLFSEISITSVSDPLLFSATSSANSTTNIVKLNTYPQKDIFLSVTGSLVVTNNSVAGVYDPIISITEHQSNGTINELVQEDLSNVSPGGVSTTYNFHLTHTIPSGSSPGTEFGFRLLSKQLVASVTGSFQFSNTQVFLTSSAASGLNLETVPEPYFGLNNFLQEGIDCQPLFNNANINRRHNLYMDVDYSAGVTEHTNFGLIESGSALKAEVQLSNYSTQRHILPRYIGSRNTTDDFNTSSISQSLYINTTQNIHLGDPSPNLTKFASVDNLDTTIFEFQYGGGTYPEIANGGALLINNVLNVGSKDAVDIFSTLDDYFDTMVTRKFRPNDSPFIFQYETSAQTTAGARVIATNLGIPPKSSFMITSSGANRAAPQSSGNQLDINAFITTVSTNTSGYYIAGSPSQEDVRNLIKQGINAGEDWYVTIYENLPDTVQGQIQPFNSGSHANYTTPDSNGNYPYPLAKNGVYEITGVTALGLLEISPTFPQTSSWNIGNNDKGALFWKSTKGKDITFEDATLSGVGKGAIVSEISSKTIKENITYITKTYGSNPSN